MTIFDPSPEDCEKLAILCDRASLILLLGAVIASCTGFVLFLYDNSLIEKQPWTFLAATAVITLPCVVAYGIRELRRSKINE